MNYTLTIQLISASCPAAGEGWGGVIDMDVVHDELGIPYIPARRIRGLLLESAREVVDQLDRTASTKSKIAKDAIVGLFGERGLPQSAPLQIDNGYLPDYKQIREWLLWFNAKFGDEKYAKKYSKLATPVLILASYTSLRQQTAIDEEGFAKAGSLRVTRVLNKGLQFSARLRLECPKDAANEELLALAAKCLRRLGSKRNRGLGSVKCDLLGDDKKSIIDEILSRYKALLTAKEA